MESNNRRSAKPLAVLEGQLAETIKKALERGSGLRYEDKKVEGKMVIEIYEEE